MYLFLLAKVLLVRNPPEEQTREPNCLLMKPLANVTIVLI